MRTCGVLLAGLLILPAAHANVSFQVEVFTHLEPKSGSKNAPVDTSATWEVVLADKAFQVKSAKETNFFDFDKRKRVVVDVGTKTQVNYSLYDTVAYRHFEFENREAIGKMMAAAKVDQAAVPTAVNEHTLAIQVKPSSPLQTKVNGTDTVFLNGSSEYFRHSVRATPVTPNEARMFAQFFRYMFGGHPQILAGLAQSKAIPAQLLLTSYDLMGTTTRKVVVKSVAQSANKPLDPPAFPARKAAAATDPLDKLLDQAEAMTPAELQAARQRSQDELAAALRDHRTVDAYLGVIEWSLMTGEPAAALTDEQKASFQSDTTIVQVNKALTARSKEELVAALKTFEDVRNAGTQKAYVIKIFEANDRAMLGDRPAAQKLFGEVLGVNPFIAGAYKDLGDVLIQSFDMPHAWRSWDLGRRMAPAFANFKAVDQLERSLSTEHPEFF